MKLRFCGAVWYWHGPAPFHFVTVPRDEAALIADVAPAVTYGWGMIPATLQVGATALTTSLWPKDGGYVVPLKTALRDAEGIDVDDVVEVVLTIRA